MRTRTAGPPQRFRSGGGAIASTCGKLPHEKGRHRVKRTGLFHLNYPGHVRATKAQPAWTSSGTARTRRRRGFSSAATSAAGAASAAGAGAGAGATVAEMPSDGGRRSASNAVGACRPSVLRDRCVEAAIAARATATAGLLLGRGDGHRRLDGFGRLSRLLGGFVYRTDRVGLRILVGVGDRCAHAGRAADRLALRRIAVIAAGLADLLVAGLVLAA